MSLQAWTPPPDGGAVETYTGASGLPRAASALIEWAQAAEAAHQLAVQLCATNFVPAEYRGDPGLGTAAILAGSEVGLSPIQSMQAFDVIDGRPAPRALTLRALMEQQGHQFIVDVSTARVAKGRAKRRGSTEWQAAEYTWAMAERRGLVRKRNWSTQPEAMLVARLTAVLARLVAADALLGIPYTADELEDQRDEGGTVTVRGRSSSRRVQRAVQDEDRPVQDVPLPDTPDPDASPADQADAPIFPPPPSDAQTRAMWARIRERFGTGDDEAGRDAVRNAVLMYLTDLLDRPIESTKDLTAEEVSTVITDLSPEPDDPAPDQEGM